MLFPSDPASVLGLMNGKDIEIMEFRPPELTFTFSYEKTVVIHVCSSTNVPFISFYSIATLGLLTCHVINIYQVPPAVLLKIGFEVTVTVDLALVLDSKGIREAIEQKQPEKALGSIAIRDIIDGVDTPLVTMSITVSAEVSVSGKINKHRLSVCLIAFYINQVTLLRLPLMKTQLQL